MEFNQIDRQIKDLVIGDFRISFYKESGIVDEEIPYAGMAFYDPEHKKADFEFEIGDVEKDESGKALYGSNDFMIPTFLYFRENGCFDWITKNQDQTPRLSFRINKNWNQFRLYDDHTNTSGERAFHEFGSLFSYAVLNHHACVLHGVIMEYNGKGIIVSAPSGTGKTTHTRMWRNHKRALIINGDRVLCRKIDGKWYAYGMPWSGSSGEYINRRVPISCIVNLNQGKINQVEKMPVFDSTLFLMQRIFAPLWTGTMQNNALSLCEELAKEIPMLKLSCLPDLESVEVLEKAMENLDGR